MTLACGFRNLEV